MATRYMVDRAGRCLLRAADDGPWPRDAAWRDGRWQPAWVVVEHRLGHEAGPAVEDISQDEAQRLEPAAFAGSPERAAT